MMIMFDHHKQLACGLVFAHTFASSQRQHSDAVKTRTTGTVAEDDAQLRMGCTRNALALWKASAFRFATGLVSITSVDTRT